MARQKLHFNGVRPNGEYGLASHTVKELTDHINEGGDVTSAPLYSLDIEAMRRVSRLTPGARIRLMLNARELVVGLKRGRLRRRYPHLSLIELNLKLLQELADAKNRQRRSEFIFRYPEYA